MQPLGINVTELQALGAVAFEGRPYIEDRMAEDGPLFPTESGKIELYSSVLKQLDFDPLPRSRPSMSRRGLLPPDLRPRAGAFVCASQNNAWLDDLMPENEAWIERSRRQGWASRTDRKWSSKIRTA